MLEELMFLHESKDLAAFDSSLIQLLAYNYISLNTTSAPSQDSTAIYTSSPAAPIIREILQQSIQHKAEESPNN